MIRIVDERILDSNHKIIEAYGLSTDTKPTDKLITGSVFYEVDTSNVYLYNEASSAWVECIGGVDSTEITTRVNAWLEAHPEATTTVQDGAITYAKLDSSLKGAYDDVGDIKSAVESAAYGTPTLAPTSVESALIQTSTGKILLRDVGILYCYNVPQNTTFIADFKGGNVHRIAVADSAFAENVVTTIIYNVSANADLGNEQKLFNTGAHQYLYIQTSANVSYQGTVDVQVEKTFVPADLLSSRESTSENLIDGHTATPSGIVFAQGKFTSSSASVVSESDIATDYFNGPAYVYNPEMFSVAVGLYDSEKVFQSFFTPSTSATSPESDYAKDSVIYLPELYGGYYRVTVNGYSDSTGAVSVYTPWMTSVQIFTDTEPAYKVAKFSSSAGYIEGFNNIILNPITLKKYETLTIDVNDSTNYQYAVYTIDGDGTISMANGGYIVQRSVFFDDSLQYIVRVAPISNAVSYLFDGKSAYNAITIGKGRQIGYCRQYTDITGTLTAERKEISGGTISDSTTCLMIGLPNVGDVEVKVNKPAVEFCVYSYDGYAYTLEQDWTLYGYRYFSDGDKQYFAFLRFYPSATTITKFGKLLKVMVYHDEADNMPINAKLYGKTVAVMGDSIVQGRYANRAESLNDVLCKPWSAIVGESTGKDADNYGIGGATVAEAGDTWKSLYTNRNKIIGYDVVFVCAGTNDCSQNVSESDFKTAYQAVIDALVSNNTEVVLVTPTSRTTESTNTAGLALSDYAGFVSELATSNSLKCIDLYSHTKFSAQFKASLPDNLHPDAIGHKIIADFIINTYS